VIRLARVFANTAMRFFRKNFLVGIPEIAKSVAGPIRFWDLVPQTLASFSAMITDYKGHNLACSSAKSSPEPIFCRFDEDKRPDFV